MKIGGIEPQIAGEQKANHSQSPEHIIEQLQHKKNPRKSRGVI
jgi:hypothetical protein